MATSNGPWQNRARIEWVYTVSGSGSSRTVSVQAYLKMDQYASQFHSGTKSWSGAWGSGSAAQYYGLNPNQRVLIVTGAPSIGLNDTARTVSFTATANHFHGTTSSTLSVTLPAKVPSTPTGLSITRISDSSHRLNWTRGSTYTAVVVQRRVNGGAWVQVGRPTGNAATYTDNTTSVNNKYEYRVAGVSAGGQSGWSNIATVYTTPAAVGAVTATKVGLDIRVTATGLPPYATAYELFDNGVLVDGNVTSWPVTVAAPDPSVTHKYTVYAKRGSLRSAGRDSNTVQLLAPPLAPSNLSPNGGVVASDGAIKFSWRHNPVDTTEQVEYRLQYRLVGGSWTTVTGTTAEYRDITLPVGDYEWQVQTRGEHATYGPYSAVATSTVVDRPGVAVQGDGVLESPELSAVWSYVQGQGRPQSAWRADLLDAGGAVVERKEGSGAATQTVFAHRGGHGETYTIRVQAATGNIWSAWAPLTVTLNFLPPAPALFDGAWDETSGTVGITVGEGRGPDRDDVVNLFTNPRLVGDGTWAEVRRNLHPNPNVAGTSHIGWGADPSAALDNISRAGTGEFEDLPAGGSLRIISTGGSASNSELSLSPPIAVTEGDTITMSVYSVSAGGSAVGGGYPAVLPRIQWSDSGFATGVEVTLSGQYQRLSITTVVPAGVTSATLRPQISPLAAGGAVRFRAAVIEKQAEVQGYFDGSTTPEAAVGVIQPEDFRWRFVGDENASESVMEIERMRGVSGNIIAGVSTDPVTHKPALRQINLDRSTGDSYTQVVGGFIDTPGVLIGTSTTLETIPIPAGLDRGIASLRVGSPYTSGSLRPNTPGTYSQRLVFDARTSIGSMRLNHGGVGGEPDVWWTDIGLFAGDYDGPVFSGDTGSVVIGDTVLVTKWDGERNNSPSRATMAPETVSVDVERSVEEGVWELVRENVEPGEVFEDRESLSNGVTQYRVTSYADTGAATVQVYDVVSDSPAIWLSGGEAFADTARLPYNPEVQVSAGRARTSKRYSGRPLPVIYSGEAVERAVQFGGSILMDDTDVAGLDTLERIAQAEFPLHQYRDPDGRRIFGMLGPISTTREAFSYWSYSASIEESER